MNILLDTHALFWFLSADKKLSEKARSTVEGAIKLFIPTIVLLELLYLVRKAEGEEKFRAIYRQLKRDPQFTITSLDIAVVEEVIKLPAKLDIHDRIIVATARLLKVPVISKDPVIYEAYNNVIW